ncbi:hypothetical protein [Longitalea luteola]|uniref:hypothetical protein n=1 Tax=Longitalea luteola TaxID=2812563 RepID=UPI001A96ADC5|nr:hypothetical protein [Longitalea luteola]
MGVVTSGKLQVSGLSGTSYRLPGTSYRLPGFQLPGTSYQVPGTSYQLPVTGYQLPVAGKKCKQPEVPRCLSPSAFRLQPFAFSL